MDRDVAFLVYHAAVGVLIACTFAAATLAFNIFGMREMVNGSEDGPLAFFIFLIFTAGTCASMQISLRIMTMGLELNESDEHDQERRRRIRVRFDEDDDRNT